jgi:hypothetical protein
MSRHFFIILFLIVSLSPAFSTDIPPGEVFGLWNPADSPYHILGDITIPSDSTLTIEPGVWVEFQGH